MRCLISRPAMMAVFLTFALLNIAPAQPAPMDATAKPAEPGLTYGPAEGLSLPKTILFSASPDSIIADAEEWSRHGVTAFFMDNVAREWSDNIWAKDGKPWTIGESDEMFQKARQANEICQRIGSETFLKISFDHFFEWFNDLAWQQADHNFRQFAIFARDTGCTGMALDIEYVGDQYSFDWEGYDYQGYTREDLVRKVEARMTRVIQILYDEFPEMVFLTFPEQQLGLGQIIHTAWIEEAARRNAPGGIHYCTEHTYRSPNIRSVFAYVGACNDLFHRLLSDRAWKYWVDKCTIAVGVWPFGFNYETVHSPGMSLEDLRQAYAASLMASPRYNWIYSHNCYEQLIGRGRDQYTGDAPLDEYLEVFANKYIVTEPRYISLARELRTLNPRDYSADLGWMPFISFAGPADLPTLRLTPTEYGDTEGLENAWASALRYYRGEKIDLHTQFATQKDWMVVGPFPNGEGFTGHKTAFPPEQGIDLNAEYDGVEGKVRWAECRQEDPRASVDLTKILSPTEHVTAYALCYVTNPQERPAQIRLATNDAGKCWLNGALIFDYPFEGGTFLDREIIPVTLPAGTSKILLKISNASLNWGFVFRITDEKGAPLRSLTYSLHAPQTE